MLTKLIAVIFFAIGGIASTNAARAWISDGLNPSIGAIQVLIKDDATGRCWTNIGEAKKYAEGALKQKGYVVSPDSGKYILTIYAFFKRTNSNNCYGTVSVNLKTNNELNGVFGWHVVSEVVYIAINASNHNNEVLNVVSRFVDELPSE
jgi:hypothetical protein